jgi:hypothetical protein
VKTFKIFGVWGGGGGSVCVSDTGRVSPVWKLSRCFGVGGGVGEWYPPGIKGGCASRKWKQEEEEEDYQMGK